MKPTDIFYRELAIDKNNTFTANISEKARYKIYYLKNLMNMQYLVSI